MQIFNNIWMISPSLSVGRGKNFYSHAPLVWQKQAPLLLRWLPNAAHPLQAADKTWAMKQGMGRSAPQQPGPCHECRTCDAIDTPSITCRTAASRFLFPPSCCAPASRRGVAPAGLDWAAVWSEEAAATRSLSCLRTLTQCCHFHLPVTHFYFFQVRKSNLAAHQHSHWTIY